MTRDVSDVAYGELLRFRDGIRGFLSWSAAQASAQGLTPMQHQLLLSIRGHDGDRPPAISDVAGHLLIRHHSAVELVDRAEKAGLVERQRDRSDRRIVRLQLTRLGQEKIQALTSAHLEELRRLGPRMTRIWRDLGGLDEERSGGA